MITLRWLKRCYWIPAVLGGLLGPVSSPADAVRDVQPRVFWASSPVRPDETVLVQGSDFGPKTIVEMARLDDEMMETPTENATAQIKHWTSVPVIQASDESLKFAVPMGWDRGVFACRIKQGAFALRADLAQRARSLVGAG